MAKRLRYALDIYARYGGDTTPPEAGLAWPRFGLADPVAGVDFLAELDHAIGVAQAVT